MSAWTAFILGLVGSLHCAGMCGPLALALPHSGKSGAAFFLGRLLYNAGRVVTYCFLGVVFGFVGAAFSLAGIQRWVSILLGIALLIGLAISTKRVALGLQFSLARRLKCSMSGLLQRRSVLSLAALGLLNGLLPCGLVYVACAGATAAGSFAEGIRFMACFGAGTIPMMLAISLSGRLIPFALRLKLQKAIPVTVFLLAVLLILRGMSLGIPYMSPILADGVSCCGK